MDNTPRRAPHDPQRETISTSEGPCSKVANIYKNENFVFQPSRCYEDNGQS